MVRSLTFLSFLLLAKVSACHDDIDTATLCRNIDNRLPCSVPELWTETTDGAAFGTFIGAATADETRSFYHSPAGCPVFERIHAQSPTFRRFISDYMQVHQPAFPDEYAEIIAMASAMKLPASSVFIQNACAELYLLFGDDVEVSERPKAINDPPIFAPYLDRASVSSKARQSTQSTSNKSQRRAGHCSDIGLLSSSAEGSMHAVQGHNEDWWSSVAGQMSVVHTPSWWGYLYPGQLPGTSMVVTSSGLSLSMNSLYPLTPGYSSTSAPNNTGAPRSLPSITTSSAT